MMKRLFYCIPLILALTLFSCAQPYNSVEPSAAENETLVELAHQNGDSLLVITDSGLCTLERGNLPRELHSGAKLKVTCDGVLETYPVQFANASAELVYDGDGLLDLYYSAFSDLMNTDSALNDDISEIALDFSSSSLTDGQKEALGYILSNLYGTGMSYSLSTYKDLESKGIIKNNTYENGLLLTLKSEVSGDTLSYSYGKYRSGTGATGMDNCKAEKKDGIWQNLQSNETLAWIS